MNEDKKEEVTAPKEEVVKDVEKVSKEAEQKAKAKEDSQKKKNMLRDYANLRRKMRCDLSVDDFTSNTQYTKDMLTHHWGSLVKIDAEAREKFPKCFLDVYIEDLITDIQLDKLRDVVKNNKRFVVTTAVTGCELDTAMLKSIKQYCTINKAELLILVASDPASNLDRGTLGRIDKRLMNEAIVIEDTHLNSNIFLSTIKLSAKAIDPITGLGRLGQRDGSFIFASPKQRLKSSPVSNTKPPHFLMTTGAITVPDYTSSNYMSNKTAHIADHDHVMGGLIIEIGDSDEYHFRQFQSDSKGRIIDLGVQYDGKVTKEIIPEAFVLGDWHAGSTCEMSKKIWKDISNKLKPKMLVMHDLFDGRSINHHEEGNVDSKAKRAASGHLNLSDELKLVAKDLQELATWTDKIVVVKSNHDEFLKRFLQKGDFRNDPYNYETFLQLALNYLQSNKDPLKYGVEEIGKLDSSLHSKVQWLARDEDISIHE